jgi:hypothetical protein
MPFDSFLDLVFAALALVPVFYLSIFVHELGHAILGWRNGFVITSFGMGLGKPFWVGSWRGARVFLCRKSFTQGITFFFVQQIYPSRRQLIAVLGGGILANLLLMTLTLVPWLLLPHSTYLLLLVASVNGIMAVTNLLPFSFRAGKTIFRSDGLQILLVLLGRPRAAPTWQRIQLVRNLRPLWESIGDRLALSVHLLDAALAWRDLGDSETAEAWAAEAEALAGNPSPARRALGALVRARLAREAGRLQECTEALDQANALFQGQKHEAGQLLCEWERAELLLRTADVAGCISALERIAQHALVLARPPLRDALLVSRLRAHAAVPAPAGGNGAVVSSVPGTLDRLLLEFNTLRRRQPSPARDLHVFWALTHYHLRRGEWKQAETVCEAALGAARQLYESIGDAADQVRFQQYRANLLTEAAGVFQQLGRPDLAERARHLFPPPGEIQRLRQEKRWQRNRRFLRLGLGVALGQLFLALPSLLVLLQFLAAKQRLVSLHFDAAWLVASIMLSLGSGIALGTALLLWVLGLLVPSLRHKGGGTVFFLAVVPWLWLLGAVVIGLLDRLGS